LVEWAIVLPVILLVTLGVLQVSLIFMAKFVANHAAFAAARAALVVPSEDPDDGRPWEERAEQVALDAARIVCSPVAGLAADQPSAPIPMAGWGGNLPRSQYVQEKLFLTEPGASGGAAVSGGKPRLIEEDGGARKVRVDLAFDVELWFPIVDELFWQATGRIEHGRRKHMRLVETCTLARGWE
jgi:hypothetical protein